MRTCQEGGEEEEEEEDHRACLMEGKPPKSQRGREEKSIAFQMSFPSAPRCRPGGKFEPRGGILIPAWATELS